MTLFDTLGIVLEKMDVYETHAYIDIDKRHLQPMGLVHGGVYVVLAESCASVAASCSVDLETKSVVALEINANHLRPAKEGRLFCTAKAIHIGRKTLVYETKVFNNQNLISIGRCTVMVVDK